MHPLEQREYYGYFNVKSDKELYAILEYIAKTKMDIDKLPFKLSDLEAPKDGMLCQDIRTFILNCLMKLHEDGSNDKVIELIQFLKNNPPEITYKNPKLPENKCTKEEEQLMSHIFCVSIDLPGSKHNPYGMGYFSDFFIDSFFGNYTEFYASWKKFSKQEKKLSLKKREGYLQFSILFAPLLGMKMLTIEYAPFLTKENVRVIREMYHGNNENKHIEIFKKLLFLGANPNVHDKYGYTPLHYAASREPFVEALLQYGANPNAESITGDTPLTHLQIKDKDSPDLITLEMMIDQKATLTDKDSRNDMRTAVEIYGSKDLAVKVREAMPRGENECEKCVKQAEKKCSACSLVYYCSPSCQKQDWKFHKVTCSKSSAKDNAF